MLAARADGFAPGTRFGRIPWINENHFHTGSCSLVRNLLLKFPEGPAVKSRPNPLPGADSLTDMREVFHHDKTNAPAEGILNDGLADFIVDMLDMPPLPA